MNEIMKKSPEKSKNVQTKTQNYQAQNLHKKDKHVYNNCYELRALKKVGREVFKRFFPEN